MHWLTGLFVAAVAAEAAIRLWLASRQIRVVRAHGDRVPEVFRAHITLAEQQRAADYTVSRVRFGRWATIADAVTKLVLTVGGGLAAIGAGLSFVTWSEPWRGCLLIGSAFFLLQLLGLPFALWRTFRIEARFGFNRTSRWLLGVDLAKQLLLGVVLGVPLTLAILSLMEKAGTWWWAWAWLVWLGGTLLLTWAAPRYIAPLFNRFTPIADAALQRRVDALLERCGFSARGGVFVMDGSRRSSHGNAYFTGLGRHRRIVFFDTLLSRIDVPEVEAVLAHELGHYRLNHVRQRLLTSLVLALAGFAALGALATQPAFYSALGVPTPSSAMALLLFTMTVPVFAFFATPLESWWSRRQERAADDYAVQYADARDLIQALVKLYQDNAATLTPDRVYSAFYDSHPPAVARIARLSGG